MNLVIASNNRNKIREIEDKLSGLRGLTLIPLSRFQDPPVIIENGATFQENARIKAVSIAEFTGQPAMADDSGLVVDALGGRPGVLSARYGGTDATDRERCLMLMEEMRGISPERRSARFECVIAVAFPGGGTYYSEGGCEGTIAGSMRGEHGFGYDPIFFLPNIGKTMAELTLEEKNKISHRAKALDGARELLLTLI
jgi:XTP/dITP diphosphohydrolase